MKNSWPYNIHELCNRVEYTAKTQSSSDAVIFMALQWIHLLTHNFPFLTHMQLKGTKRHLNTFIYTHKFIPVHKAVKVWQWTLPFYVSTFKTSKSMLLGGQVSSSCFPIKKHLNCMFSGEWPINSTSWIINLCIQNLRISTDDEKSNLHTTHRQTGLDWRENVGGKKR